MKTKKSTKWFFAFFLIAIANSQIYCQQQQALYVQESSVFGSQEMFLTASKVQIKGSDTYTIGSTLDNAGSYNMLITKHDASNQLLWSKQFNGSFNGDDYGADVAVDANNNVYIVGSIQAGVNDYDAVIVKYNSSGLFLWSRTYGGPANLLDGFNSITLDASGNVYCVGGAVISPTQLTDVIVRKYDTSGTLLWGSSFNSPFNLQDIAHRVVISTSTIIIGGASQSSISPISWRLTRFSFNLNSGVMSGAVYTGGDNSELDEISDLIIDSAESIYVCGSKNVSGQGKNLRIIKYNNSLVEQWVYEKNGSVNQDDHAFALTNIDNLSIAFTGYTHTSEGKKAIIGKLNANTGVSQWTTEWNGIESTSSEGYKIAKNLSNDLFVAANNINEFNQDVALIKVSQSNGSVLAHGYFNGDSNGLDAVYSMAVNGSNIFIATQTEKDVGFGYALVKWREQTVYLPQNFGAQSSQGYEVNNGQVRNAQGLSDTESKYYNYTSYPSTYLLNNQKMSMVFMKPIDETSISSQRVDMGFKNANTVSDWVPIKLMPSFTNYYLTHMSQPSLKTEMFSGVVWKDIYPNVDLMFTQNELAYRYYFVVRSGANVSNIKSEYSGHTSIGVGGDGKLKIGLEWTTEEQERPIAYSMNNSTGALTQHAWQPSYVVTGNEVAFGNIGSWTGTLVIEINSKLLSSVQLSCPGTNNIEWSTFFGGSGEDELNAIDINEEGEAFVVGSTNSTFLPQVGNVAFINIPVYNHDFWISKFLNDCRAEWSTIFGGSNFDLAYDVIYTHDDKIHVIGITRSENLTFSSNGMNDETLNGLRDGFYLKLNQDNGSIDVDSYIGGEGAELMCGISCAPATQFNPRKIYMIGSTNSSEGWQLSSLNPASDVLPYSGFNDGVVICINDSDLNQPMLWSSFFGTTGNDQFYDVIADGEDVYITGQTDADEYSAPNILIPSQITFPHFFNSNDFSYYPEFSENNSFLLHFNSPNSGAGILHNLNFSTLVYSGYHAGTNLISSSLKLSATKSVNGRRKIYLSGTSPTNSGTIIDPFQITGSGWHQSGLNGDQNRGYLIEISHNRSINTFLNTWSSFFGADNSIGFLKTSISENGQFSLTGTHNSSNIQDSFEYCDSNTGPQLTMCNLNDFQHMEENIDNTDHRGVTAQFTASKELTWSTQLGCGNYSRCKDITSTNNKSWIIGDAYTNFTLFDFDGTDNTSYYKPFNQSFSDGVIMRFQKQSDLLLANENEDDFKEVLSVYPNPSNDIVRIKTKLVLGDATLRAYDSLGNLVLETRLKNETDEISIKNWRSGTYSFILTSDNYSASALIIKL